MKFALFFVLALALTISSAMKIHESPAHDAMVLNYTASQNIKEVKNNLRRFVILDRVNVGSTFVWGAVYVASNSATAFSELLNNVPTVAPRFIVYNHMGKTFLISCIPPNAMSIVKDSFQSERKNVLALTGLTKEMYITSKADLTLMNIDTFVKNNMA